VSKHKQRITGVRTHFAEQPYCAGIDHLSLEIVELELDKELFGVPIYRTPFNGVSVTVECQTNRSEEADRAYWYGLHVKTDSQNESDLKRTTAIARKILKDVHSSINSCQPVLERIYDMFTPVVHDNRVSDFVRREDVEKLENVRGWIDLRSDNMGCTVNAYTRFKEPTPEQIQDAIKRELCGQGYPDQLVRWVNAGMPYKEMHRGSANALPIPPKFYLDYPTTKVKPEDAWAELNRKTAA